MAWYPITGTVFRRDGKFGLSLAKQIRQQYKTGNTKYDTLNPYRPDALTIQQIVLSTISQSPVIDTITKVDKQPPINLSLRVKNA